MRFLFASFFAALLSVSAVAAGDVAQLGAADFKAYIAANPVALVKFYAPWCGHCKSLAPEFEAAATDLKPSNIALAEVDCTVEKDLCSEFGVQGFPTLKIFRSSSSAPAEYNGGRKQNDIVKYMKKQTEPAFTTLTTAAELTALSAVERDGVLLVGVFPSADTDEAKAFIETAGALRNDHTFAIVNDAALAASFATVTAPAVVLVKSEEDPSTEQTTESVVFSGTYDVASLSSFIKTESFPLVGEIGPENFQKYMERGFPLFWLFVDNTSPLTEPALAVARKVAALPNIKSAVSIVHLDGVKWAEHAKHFGLKAGELPGLVLEDREDSKNFIYPFSKAITEENVKDFVEQFLAKTLPANLKSQEAPADNSGPLTTLVGSTFESIVNDDSKDVFVEFYAPWCGHCKSLAPKYEALAQIFADNDKVVIAQVDATENDTPVKVQGFPTLKFFRAGDKKNPLSYDGERTTEAMAAFIRENGNTFAGAAAAAPAEPAAAAAETKDEL